MGLCAPTGPCWAGGNQLIGSHEGFAAAWLVTPAPGGSWRLERGCSPGVCSEPVTDVGSCPASNRCYAVNNSSPFGDGSSVGIYTATGQNGPNVTLPNGLVINDIACPAARTCYAGGAGGTIEALPRGVTPGYDRSDSPNPRRSGTTTSAAPDTSGTTSR